MPKYYSGKVSDGNHEIKYFAEQTVHMHGNGFSEAAVRLFKQEFGDNGNVRFSSYRSGGGAPQGFDNERFINRNGELE